MPLDNDARELLGSRILAARKRVGLSRKAVASAVDTSAEALAQYERGQRLPKIDRLCDIAAACETSASDLLNGVISSTDRKR